VLTCECKDYADSRGGSIAALTIVSAAALKRRPPAPTSGRAIVFIIPRAWLSRAADRRPAPDGGGFYLPDALNGIAVAALEAGPRGFAADLYRAAKCQELLCEVVRLWLGDALVARAAGGAYSLADAERLMQARRMIATRYAEKLTLEGIARACGLNRAKLTQGFRELFNQTVSEALTEQRLLAAAGELRTSGKPVASVGYAAGYLNNASFARAFAKRFGQCPTDFRRSLAGEPAMPTAIAA
jgi:AraC family transcriptional regulator, transcriptional activator of the genes for pyochelin and ferripyochelin receptors